MCRFIPYVTWSFGLCLKMVKYVSFRYKRYNIHNHRYHIVMFITKEQIFLHSQSKSKTGCNIWYERALKYVLFRTIPYAICVYTTGLLNNITMALSTFLNDVMRGLY